MLVVTVTMSNLSRNVGKYLVTGPQPAAPSESEQYHLLCLSIKELETLGSTFAGIEKDRIWGSEHLG